jgi:heme-degrading monooxygenase HmoA
MLTATFATPYYAVIFTSLRVADDGHTYEEAAQRMVELAREQPGFLGVESARGSDGLGITVSYWTDEAAIAAWKNHAEHSEVRQQGRKDWYRGFTTRVCRVERNYAQNF